ncbi:MAG: hypothetical protein HXY34_03140 [Candidatus Thorarchaeota archaeon]|nr:hypothetical protein [Candidatus Thorarchaeota archaeon]
MSFGYSLYHYRKERNPVIQHLHVVGATSPGSAVELASIVERVHVRESSIRRLVRGGWWVSSTEDGRLYLDVALVKRRAIRSGIGQLVLMESVIVVVVLLTAIQPETYLPPEILLLILGLLSVMVVGFAYLEAWPYFYLRRKRV